MQTAPGQIASDDSANVQQRRALFAAYITFLFILTAAFGLGNILARDEWAVGDWLINYQAGSVRRGLIGELVFRLGHLTHISPLLFIWLLQIACYAVIFYAGFVLLSQSSWRTWVLALAFSPATFAFQVTNQSAGFRKEELLLAGLGGLLLISSRRISGPVLTFYLSLLSVICILSHEGLIFFFPYLFAGLALGLQNWKRACAIGVLPMLLDCGIFTFVARHPGDANTATRICASLGFPVGDALPKPCSGAISMIGKSAAWSRADTQHITHAFHYSTVYSVTALLALVPIAWGACTLWRDRQMHRDLLTIAAAAAFSLAGTVVLMLYTVDWGRWIYTHTVCLFFLLLVVDSTHRTTHANTIGEPRRLSKPSLAAFIVYATCWSVPHMGSFQVRAGYLYLLHAQIAGK